MLKKCLCCKQQIKVSTASQTYCTSCSIYTRGLRMKISQHKTALRKLRLLVYGQKRGSERVRFKDGQDGKDLNFKEQVNNKYFIICTEEKSNEGTFLFWKSKGIGYTSDVNKAGLFSKGFADETNKKGRDIALTREEMIENLPRIQISTVVDCAFIHIWDLKKKLKGEIK